jgi:hypothetical protein
LIKAENAITVDTSARMRMFDQTTSPEGK